MAVYLRKGSRFYWISIYMGKGVPRKYIPTGTDDENEAIAMERMILAAKKRNTPRQRFIDAVDDFMGWNDDGDGVPVDQLWETYLKTNQSVGVHEHKQRRLMVTRFMNWMAEERPKVRWLHDINPQTAIAFADHLKEVMGGKGKTQNERVGKVRIVFKHIYARAGLNFNPFDGVPKVPEKDSVSGRPWTPDELKRIYARCIDADLNKPWWQPVCKLGRYTALRLKDIALLRWDQVHEKHMDLTPQKTRKHGIKVLMPLHPEVIKELNMLKRKGKYVFPELANRYQGKHPESGFMEEIITPLGIDPDGAYISFHCFRHTVVDDLKRAGVDKATRMKIAGHTKESTAEIYEHWEDFEALDNAIGKLPSNET